MDGGSPYSYRRPGFLSRLGCAIDVKSVQVATVSTEDADAHGLTFDTHGRLIRAQSGPGFIAGTLSEVGSPWVKKFGDTCGADQALPSRLKLLGNESVPPDDTNARDVSVSGRENTAKLSTHLPVD